MTTIRRITVSQIDGNGADDTNTSELRPFGETAFYIDNNNKLTLSIFDGTRTHRKSKVLAPGVLWGSNADSGDGNSYDTIKLIPDAEIYANGSDQYIIIDPTGPNHVHIRAGGTIDNSNSELIIGGETSHIKLGASSNPPVYIRANDNQWAFGTDGILTLPAGGDIVNSSGTSVLSGGGGAVAASDRITSSTYSVILEGTTGTITIPGPIIGSGGISLAVDQYSFDIGRRLRLRDGDISSHIHIDSPDNATYDLIWGDDYKFVRVDHVGTVVIGTNDGTQREWTFQADGVLSLPSGGTIQGVVVTNSELGTTTTSVTLTPPNGFDSNMRLDIYPTEGGEGNHLHLTAGDQSTTDLYLGNDSQFVSIRGGGNIDIVSRSGSVSPSPGTPAGQGHDISIYAGHAGGNGGNPGDGAAGGSIYSVSYTHLTLPTKA